MVKVSERLDALFDKAFGRGDTPDSQMAIEAPGLSWQRAARPEGLGARYCIASCTKLYTAALVIQACERGELDIDAPAQGYLPTGAMAGLNMYGGTDHAGSITVRHLLSNTSGIPDFFEGKLRGGQSILDEIIAGEDKGWTFDDVLRITRAIPAPFAPGTSRAHYSDTNFELLGAILSRRMGLNFAALVQRDVAQPLGLHATAVFGDPMGPRYGDVAPIRAGRAVLDIPTTLVCLGPHGAVISTLEDSLAFLDGFFSGRLFSLQWLAQMQHWKPLFFPMRYGMGLMRFSLPPAMTLFRRLPDMIGHSGASGVLMYANPERGIRIVGSTNQLAGRDRPYRFLAAAVNLLR
jgi:CubicO group peptidase (beta-lactamase class C family)